jgi:hypothetical protein
VGKGAGWQVPGERQVTCWPRPHTLQHRVCPPQEAWPGWLPRDRAADAVPLIPRDGHGMCAIVRTVTHDMHTVTFVPRLRVQGRGVEAPAPRTRVEFDPPYRPLRV